MRKVLALVCLATLAACSSPDVPAARNDPPPKAPSSAASTEKEPHAPGCRTDCAPDFAVTSFKGERFALADHFGKVVVINFFESW